MAARVTTPSTRVAPGAGADPPWCVRLAVTPFMLPPIGLRMPAGPAPHRALRSPARRPTHGHPSYSWLPGPDRSADSNALVAPIMTGETVGRNSRGSNVSRTRNPAARAPSQRAGGGQADRGEERGRNEERGHGEHPCGFRLRVGCGAVEDGDSDAERGLEREQLQGEGARLAQEDAGGIEARQAQAVADRRRPPRC